jgi:hypothetical protein
MRKLFFELMQVSVGQLDCVSRFPEPNEWQKFYELAKKQAVIGVCYHGVTKLFDYGLVAPQELSLDWMAEAEEIKEVNRGRTRKLITLQEELQKHHLRSSVMTGPGLTRFYDRELQMLRYTKGIDVYVFGYKNQLDLSQWADINVRILSELRAGKSRQRNNKLDKWVLQNDDLMFRKAGEMVVPSHSATILIQLTNLYNLFINKRLLMRNLMDLFFVIRFAQGDSRLFQYPQNTLEGVIKDLGLTRFTRGIMWLLQEVFALDPKILPLEPLEEEGQYLLSQIMGDVFTFHNWWHHLWHYRWHELT